MVTSGPRLGDLESGIAASLTTAGVAVVSGGFACVAGVALIVLLFPALAAYDGQPRRLYDIMIAPAIIEATLSTMPMMPQISAAFA